MFSRKVNCPACGTKNSRDRMSCTECGAPLASGETRVQSAEVPSESKPTLASPTKPSATWTRKVWFWIGVTLLSISALLWLLAILGTEPEDIGEVTIGLVVLTVVPIGIGIYGIRRGGKGKPLRKALIYFVILVAFIGAIYLLVEGKLSIEVISFGFSGLVVLFVIILPLSKALRNKKNNGLTENVGALLCYVLGWISGLVFILAERENKFIRFHAMQSIIVFGAHNIISLVLVLIAVLQRVPDLGLLFLLIFVSGIMLDMVLMIKAYEKAYEGTKFKLPWLGNIAEKWAG